LKQAINLVAQRHSALRTTFTDSGGKLQQVVHGSLMPEFACHEMLGASDPQVREKILHEVQRPFCLETGPLLRIAVYQLGHDDWVVLAATHHIIVDFWSLIIILSELRAAYPQILADRKPQLDEAQDNYRDFVLEQHAMLPSTLGNRMAEHWENAVSATPAILELPTDVPRPASFTHRAESVPIRISTETSRHIARLAVTQRSTPFAVVHAALQVLLCRYSRQTEFLIGSPFSGRSNQKFEQTVGFFINMLPVKASLQPEQPFLRLIQQTTLRLMETLDNESTPIAEIVRRASVPRDPSRSPLFQVSFTFERSQRREELGRAGFLFPDQTKVFDFAGMRQESFYIPHPTCHYDLEFVFEQSDMGLGAMLIYCRDLFHASSMQYMADNFSDLLESLLHHPGIPVSQVPWRSQPKLVPAKACTPDSPLQAPKTTLPAPEPTVDGLILESIKKAPGQVAMQWSQRCLTYAELHQVANSLSEKMVRRGVSHDRLVPVFCRQGPHAFAAMLAVHRAGGAAVPVDLSQPATSVDRVFMDTQAPWALTDARSDMPQAMTGKSWFEINFEEALLPLDRIRDNEQAVWATERDSSHLAYMIYTSGSTGQPKGVLVEHGSICNTLCWRARTLPLFSHDRVLMLLSHQFDASLGIGWSALTQGARLVWPDLSAKLDPTLLLQQIQRDQITILPVVPSLLRVLIQNPLFSKCSSLRSIWTGGEALPSDLPSQIRGRLPVSIWNLYGPTEAAVEATAADVTQHLPNRNMTIGHAIDGMEILIVDSSNQPNPPCVPGEIAIAGPGLARGYHEDAQLTARRFVQHPEVPSRRMYLTGDLGRQLPDGSLEFLGRLDQQVKLRGFRIELGEIESFLQSHPSVDRAAVVLYPPHSATARLVAYVQPANARVDQLYEFLTMRLAQYKLPSTIVALDHLPMTSSGKVDRKSLPAPSFEQSCNDRQVPPRNELEQWLAGLWCQELEVESLGVHQNFFEAGGSSLQAAMVTTKMSTGLAVHVPTALLFDLATIAQVASRLVSLYPERMGQQFGQAIVGFYSHAKSHEASVTLPAVHSLLAPLQPTGSLPPLFMVHPPGGIVLCYRELARHLPPVQPLWAIRSRGLHGQEELPDSMAAMAYDYIQAIGSLQNDGPYILGGWSLGGLVAYEMAKQLIRSGKTVRQLVFLDTSIPEGATDCVPVNERVNVGLEYGIEWTLDQLGDLSAQEQLPMLYDHAAKLGILTEQSAPEVVEQVLKDLQHLFQHHIGLARNYRLEPIPVNLLLLRPQEVPYKMDVAEDRGWRHLVSSVQVRFTPGHHHSMVQSPHAQHMAGIIAQELAEGKFNQGAL